MPDIEVLVVGGGGSGGARIGAGGGAGGLVYDADYAVVYGTEYTVTVGAGGAAKTNPAGVGAAGNDGAASAFDALSAPGGGGGGAYSTPANGRDGGCGGGAGGYTAGSGGTGSPGYNGGAPAAGAAGGGGGMGAVGVSGGSGSQGGAGLEYSQFAPVGGSPAGWFAGGGGGSRDSGWAAGGTGGGGGGVDSSYRPALSGIPHTGGGGGGLRDSGDVGGYYSGAGGSGIVVVRYSGTPHGRGGLVTQSGGYTFQTFHVSGTFILSDPAGDIPFSFEVLVVGGGASGGCRIGGGGGAGGAEYSAAHIVDAGTAYPVVIGPGGAAKTSVAGTAVPGAAGSPSTFDYLIGEGGGGGGGYMNDPRSPGRDGGCGGGAGGYSGPWSYGGMPSQGFAGGGATGQTSGGGGGGMAAAGAAASGTSDGGAGKEHASFAAVAGSPAGYFAGGGGGSRNSGTSAGGTGGGGGGVGGDTTPAGSGTANTGGGGGGIRCGSDGSGLLSGAGGSGVVVIRYAGSPVATGGTITETGGYTYHVFTADGSFELASENEAPVVDAGDDQSITLPAGATLDGSATDDGLPDPPAALTYLWEQVSGPGTATFVDDTDPTTDVSFDVAGVYVLKLTADDSELTDDDTVTITVNEPTALALTRLEARTLSSESAPLDLTRLEVRTLSPMPSPLDLTRLEARTLSGVSAALELTRLEVRTLSTIEPCQTPVEGEDLSAAAGPLVFVEWFPDGSTSQPYAEVDLPDPATYYGGYKPARLVAVSEIRRAAAGITYDFEMSRFEVTFADTDGSLRGTLIDPVTRYWTKGYLAVYLVSDVGRRAQVLARRIGYGRVERPPLFDGLRVTLRVRDWIGSQLWSQGTL